MRRRRLRHATIMFERLESRIALSASTDNDPLASPAGFVAPSGAVQATAEAAPVVLPGTALLARSAKQFTIEGSGFDPANRTNRVSLSGGATGRVRCATENTLTVAVEKLPRAGATLRAVVTSFGRKSGAAVAVARVRLTPTVTRSTQPILWSDDTFQIRGKHFDPIAAHNAVTFNRGAVGKVVSATATTLTVAFTTPPSGGKLTAVVTSFGGASGKRVRVATVTGAPNVDTVISTRATVPDPVDVSFRVQFEDRQPINLAGHYWYNKPAVDAGQHLPAIVEFNPYRRRDGTIAVDSRMYPYFASQGYLCYRIDLQGAGDSEGVLTDEYTEEELSYCVQIIKQIAESPLCDGKVGMMGESWSALNSLMVAARDDCPDNLKAIIVNCGSDDRYNDDVHYMGGAMMMDNAAWASSMWGWLSQPPDPLEVGADRWQSMWKERIDNANFWFEPWATHQTRDEYWSKTSVRNDFSKVKVPVLVMSGWEDGYKNPVDTVVRGLAQAGKTVSGLIGPWGHKYPNTGSPGPRENWLPDATMNWWDQWLKDVKPSPDTTPPQMKVWLGESREPRSATDFTDQGKWVAENADWETRVNKSTLYLSDSRSLLSAPPAQASSVTGSSKLVFATNMLETSSFGTPGNNDLAGDQTAADNQSLYFDSAPLESNVDCFGKPVVNLTLSCDQPIASIAVRLSEVSPLTGEVHLVSYTFFNLTQRNGDQAHPTPVTPGAAFTVPIPLNLIGHTFKEGWKLRIAVSPSFFPTLWQSAQAATITVYTGTQGSLPASSVTLPVRPERAEDALLKTLPNPGAPVISVDTSEYARARELRKASFTRVVAPVDNCRDVGVTVSKTMDSGRYRYAATGPLRGLLVDQVLHENFQMHNDDPLSYKCFTSSETTLRRTKVGWGARSKTSTEVTSFKDESGAFWFHYTATIETWVTGANGREHPFVSRTVEGNIRRFWV
jgi:putative CocE/NonD family hydrolase